MATEICVRRLTKELRALHKEPMLNPKITVAPLESNICEMHFCIEPLSDTPYADGVYHGKLIFPKDYPLKPPSVIMCTPSGRFTPNRRLCLSMSDFHPETWNPVWSVETILTGLYSFMIETAPTLGSVESSTRQKKQYARQSLEYNCRDGTFCKLFPDFVLQHEQEVAARPPAPEPVAGTSSSTNTQLQPGMEMQPWMATAAGLFGIMSIVLAMRFI